MHLGQLRGRLGLGGRHMQRRCTMAAGYALNGFLQARFPAPSESCRYGRYPVNLARFAADAVYADQAHMTRDV
jgi:hypothetical protein